MPLSAFVVSGLHNRDAHGSRGVARAEAAAVVGQPHLRARDLSLTADALELPDNLDELGLSLRSSRDEEVPA